jgi:hypothetical protein
VVQLVARELHDEHVEAARVANGVEHGHADVAARGSAQAVGREERGSELHRRRLAVGAGDEDPLGGVHLVAHAPGELDVAPHRDGCVVGPLEHGVVGVEAGRRDEQLGRERGQLVGHGVERMPHQARPDHLEDARPVVVDRRGEHEHVGAELRERVGHGEPVTPSPSTATRSPRQSAFQLVRVSRRAAARRGIRFGQLCSHSK